MNIWKGLARLFINFIKWVSKMWGKKYKNKRFQKKVISKIEIFKELSEKTKNIIFKDFFEKWYLKGKSINWYLGYLKKRINFITRKLAAGKELTQSQQKFFDEFKEMFQEVAKKNKKPIVTGPGAPNEQDGNRSSHVNSSWIISATYWIESKVMMCKFVRSAKEYFFFEVPEWVFIHLVTLPSNAGSWWWREWLWKYGTKWFNGSFVNRKRI